MGNNEVYDENNSNISYQDVTGITLDSERSKSVEEDCKSSLFMRVPDQRKQKETVEKGADEKECGQEFGVDTNSQKELSKQVDEVSQVLERTLPIKVVLPPTHEENSRCKGSFLQK